jgi:pSer/pThr/pTyr-binding forkhead associated (FHA) protein
MAVLIIQTGKRRGQRLRLAEKGKEILVGHGEGCQLRLSLHGVSDRHCSLRSTSEGLLVRDLGGESGTFVNNSRITGETMLRPGDSLRLGSIEFLVGSESEPAPATEKPGTEHVRATEDNIIDWLTEGESEAGHAGIAGAPVRESGAGTKGTVPKPQRKHISVADEGREIIRRWQQMQRTTGQRRE